MRKLISSLLCLAVALGLLSGCVAMEPQKVEKPYPAYSKVWVASDSDVQHATGDMAIDDGWGAVFGEAYKPGALCSASTEKLTGPVYTAAARLLVNEVGPSTAVAAVLRVVSAEGKELGKQIVRICDFDAKLTYQDFEFTFSVEEPTEATIEIYWPGTNYVRVSEFGIMSKNLDSLTDITGTGAELLGMDIEEESEIVFEEDTMYYFDLNNYMLTEAAHAEQQYDIANLVSTLQGLVNRDGQRLFIKFMRSNGFSSDTDSYWFNYLTAKGRPLNGKKVVTVKSPATLLKIFDKYYTGFAAWDPTVPATVNAVATACGVENLLPVRYESVDNSLYGYITSNEQFAEKPVKVNLGGVFTGEGTIYQTDIQTTGSRKNDAYIWAKEQYLDTRKTNSHLVAYHVDAYASNTVFAPYNDLQNMYLSNRDYYIANKAFFFDLSPMAFEIPDDDPDQADLDLYEIENTIDYDTFKAIMTEQAAYAAEINAVEPIDVGGFTPWHLKYTRFTNPDASGEVTCEWETVYQFSIFNAYINADAPSYTAMANASIYSKLGYDQKTYTQTADKAVKETLPTSEERGVNYLMFFMGDFDASAWLNTAMIKLWNDENRGKIPLCWPFSLNISKRAGHVIDMMYETATANDYFVAGDNGVGYLNPEGYGNALSADVNGDLDSWAAYNKTVYERFDIDYTGFLITRSSATSDILECYAKFCKGAATNYTAAGQVEGFTTVSSVDYVSVQQIVDISSVKGVGSASTFRQIRFILRSPSDVVAIYNQLTSDQYKDYNFKVVDPYTFYGLLAQSNA